MNKYTMVQDSTHAYRFKNISIRFQDLENNALDLIKHFIWPELSGSREPIVYFM